jgi:hypothetical protein
MPPHPLDHAIEVFREGIDDEWDSDYTIEGEIARARPPARFVQAAHAIDPEALRWLVYFSARRALSCWELSCEETRPRRIVEALGRHLREGAQVDWSDAIRAERSPFNDCRYSDTQSAANAVAEAARFLHLRNPGHVDYCISFADVAYDHVLVEDRFREWLIDVAIPVALQKREMTPEEQEALRGPLEPDTES